MMCSLKSYTSYPECRFFHVGTFILLHGDLSSLHVQFKRNPLTLNLFYTYSHSFLRACGVLCILWAWWAMMMSFCSTSPPRRRSMPWGLRDPEPWSDEPSSCSHGTSKLAARGGSPRHSGTAWGTCREQERAPCASPGRAAGLDRLQASGSGRDREDWTCVCPRRPPMVGELGLRERERDFSELVNISTEVGPWQFQHNAANGEKGERGRGWWVKSTAIIFHKHCPGTSCLSPSCLSSLWASNNVTLRMIMSFAQAATLTQTEPSHHLSKGWKFRSYSWSSVGDWRYHCDLSTQPGSQTITLNTHFWLPHSVFHFLSPPGQKS